MSAAAARRGIRMKGKQTLGPSGREDARIGPRAAAWLARSVCAVSLALAGSGLLLLAANRVYLGVPVFEEWVEDTVIAVDFSVVGR